MSDSTDTQPKATIDLCPDGPMIINTPATINGTEVEAGAALCRCGHSSNKPFCDGSHNTQGFRDAGDVESKTAGDHPYIEALAIKTAPNGPVLCSGPLTLRSADGSATFAGPKAALCRCGQSQNKPFCDGTHSKVGFEAV